MTILGDLMPKQAGANPIPTWVARVANSPANPDDALFVTSSDVDGGETRFEARGWRPRVMDDTSVACPDVGDTALIAYDAEGSAWCVSWEPA